MNAISIAWHHVIDRFGEKSTYVSIVAAVGSAAAFPSPFSWLGVIFGVAGVLIPTS